MPQRTTLAAVAERAGVSVSTASRVLSGRGDLATATRRRVLEAARVLGYRRDPSSGGRLPRSAGLMDLVLSGYHNAYSDEVTAGARSAAAAAGYDLVLTEERDDPSDDWPWRIRRRGSAGVVLGLISPTASQLAVLTDAGIPAILTDPRSESTHGLASVRTTDRDGGFEAAVHLASRGATRFAVVVGTPSYRYGRARREGFAGGVASARPGAAASVVEADWSAATARDAVLPVLRGLSRGERLGVFACSDEMAAGVYGAAATLGLRIPDDVLVVGFDDVRGARWLAPALTTVRQPIREMATAAVNALVDAAAGGPLPVAPLVLPTTLVVRSST